MTLPLARARAIGSARQGLATPLARTRIGRSPTGVDPAHHRRSVGTFGARAQTLGEARFPDARFVFRGGRLVGVWEYDPDRARVASTSWDAADRHPRMDTIAEETGTFLREQLGHGLVYSLDTAAGQRARVAAIRAFQS